MTKANQDTRWPRAATAMVDWLDEKAQVSEQAVREVIGNFRPLLAQYRDCRIESHAAVALIAVDVALFMPNIASAFSLLGIVALAGCAVAGFVTLVAELVNGGSVRSSLGKAAVAGIACAMPGPFVGVLVGALSLMALLIAEKEV